MKARIQGGMLRKVVLMYDTSVTHMELTAVVVTHPGSVQDQVG